MKMNSECFVPNCKSSEGVPFPDDPAETRAWLIGLRLPEGEPQQGAFVCKAHFHTCDLNGVYCIVNFIFITNSILFYCLPVEKDGTSVIKFGAVPNLQINSEHIFGK